MAVRPPLKQLFSSFTFPVTDRTATEINRWCVLYCNRDTHPDALNTPMLGLNKLGFYTRDTQALFDILGIDRMEFKRTIKMSSIPSHFQVATDEFNLLVAWASYQFANSKLSKGVKEQTITSLYFMLLVKFFSSLLRHYFPYGANKGIMEATIDSLTDKFDIKHEETSTWKLIMLKRAEEMNDPKNIHWNTMNNFLPDQKVVYILTDLQTRIRSKVRGVAEKYYEMVKAGKSIGDIDLTTTDKEGEKIVRELKTSFDGMISSICNRVINIQQFVREDFITITHQLIRNANADLMRNMLMQYSSMATIQYQKRQQDLESRDKKLFLGYHILIMNLIQRTYRRCILEKVDLKNRAAILKKAVDMYSASRINDEVVLKIKDSIGQFVLKGRFSSRDSTRASLKIAFVVYIILMSFDVD